LSPGRRTNRKSQCNRNLSYPALTDGRPPTFIGYRVFRLLPATQFPTFIGHLVFRLLPAIRGPIRIVLRLLWFRQRLTADLHRLSLPLAAPSTNFRLSSDIASFGSYQRPSFRLAPIAASSGSRQITDCGLRRNLHVLTSTKLSFQLAPVAAPLAAPSLEVRFASDIVCFGSPRRTCSRLSSGSPFSDSRQLVRVKLAPDSDFSGCDIV